MTIMMMKISLNPKNLLGASPEVFALMAKFFLANGAGREKPSVSPPTFCKTAAQPPTWRNPNAIFLGKSEFFWKAELNSRDHFNNICGALNFFRKYLH